jgi:hypothetical protein
MAASADCLSRYPRTRSISLEWWRVSPIAPNDMGLFMLPPEMAPVFSQALDLDPRSPDMTALVQREGA